jgi:hypothetical protein
LQLAPSRLGSNPTPLLEEECNPLFKTAITQIGCPLLAHRAVARTRLATGNEPIDSIEVEIVEWPKKRLRRNKTDGCGYFP